MRRCFERILPWAVVCLFVGGCATGRRGDDDDDDQAAEECANGYDEDGDHLVDCFDPDCAALPACAPHEVCGNEADDDGDLQVDCHDPDCSWQADCADTIETSCGNGADDDDDGLIDCAEPECAADAACRDARPPVVDCDAVCAHASECGTAQAGPDCLSQCRCSVDDMLSPDFATGYFGCLESASCNELADPNACVLEAGDVEPSSRASQVITSCTQREDCAGFPCEMLSMLSDDLLDDIDACMRSSDCITCIDVSSTCP